MGDSISKYGDAWVPDSDHCKACGSKHVGNFGGEIGIHLRGAEHVDKPTVWVFPELIVCLSCGVAQFVVPEHELRMLVKSKAAGS